MDKCKGKGKSELTTAAALRRQAEDRLHALEAESTSRRNETETQKLLHELQVHQIELEMQNAELLTTQEELELSRNRQLELYEFAPIGYFCLGPTGRILEVNLHGAELLGTERERLMNRSIIEFMADADQREIFSNHLRLVVYHQVMLKCEVSLKRPDGTAIYGKFQSLVMNIGHQSSMILCAAFDNTPRRLLEIQLQIAHDQLEETVLKRTAELTEANALLVREIEEHQRAKEALQSSCEEIHVLKDRLLAENIYLQEEVAREYNFSEIIGDSDAISYVFFRVDQVAAQDVTVLLLGETGTGKGLIARAIHRRSARKDRPMITVNCSSLPANLIESELFGREKGAFTGAHERQLGRFDLANGGTIFLDEIGEMPMELQCKLLRVIQEGEYERLGNPRTIKVDVRIIAASNRDLEEEVRAGRFRQDLFYRLNVFPIIIPPLRQRREDIPLLVNFFVIRYNKKSGKKIVSVSPETLNALREYHWPGNVRELENVIERAVITSQGSALQVLDRLVPCPETEETAAQEVKGLANLERDHIVKVLQTTGWRIDGPKGGALLLGLNPSTLRARMRKYGIRRQ